MGLTIFNEFISLRLLYVEETRFAFVIIMLRRLKLIKGGLKVMAVNEHAIERWHRKSEGIDLGQNLER